MSACLSPEILGRYLAGELAAAEALACEQHALSCRRCARALSEAAQRDELVARGKELEAQRGAAPSAWRALEDTISAVSTTLLGGPSEGGPLVTPS